MVTAQKRSWLVCLGLAVLIAAVYWPVRHFAFLVYDDQQYVAVNSHVQQGLNLHEMARMFYTVNCNNWHPLTMISHMLDWQLFGANPGMHHLTNVLIHILNSIVLLFAAYRMTGAFARSAILAALFALHPLRVESVAWIAERKDVLCTFFFLAAVWSYARYTQTSGKGAYKFYALVLLTFALGFMSKPTIVTLPFALLLLDVWPLRRWKPVAPIESTGLSSQDLLKEKIPLFLMTIAGSVVAWWAQASTGAVSPLSDMSLAVRIENALVAYAFYLRAFFWPANLASPYPHHYVIPVSQFVPAAVVLALISTLAIRFRKQAPWFIIGWLWYLGTLVPTIGLVQTGMQAYADRFTYVPSIGLGVAVIWGIAEYLKTRPNWKPIAITACFAALLACVVVTRIQLQYWANTKVLFEHAIAVTGDNPFAEGALATYFLQSGDADNAINHAQKALRIAPDYADPHDTLALAYTRKGMDTNAIAEYHVGLKSPERHTNKDLAYLHNGYGLALARTGDINHALEQFKQSIAYLPTWPDGHFNYGVGLLNAGKREQAVAEFHETLRLQPNHAGANKS